MWHNLSLRGRLILLLALVLMLGLAVNFARLVWEAPSRVRAEDQSVVRLARELVETLVADLNEARDPNARLERIVRDLNRLRHVSITRGDEAAPATADPDAASESYAVPAWFVGLVHPEKTTVTIPVSIQGKPGSLVVTSHPNDEIKEIWDEIVTQLQVGSAMAAALLLITMTVVSRGLAPIQSLADAMTGIEAGNYDTRVKPAGSPEVAAICSRLNHLAATLGQAVEDKRQLAERAVSLQDAERKEIARELHDEFGPYLFALRAHASSLMRIADMAEPNKVTLKQHGAAVLDQVNALQQFNRRVLDRLRPVGLAELGLREAIGALVRLWRQSHPEVTIKTNISQLLGRAGETAELTIYRTVQEALTNVFRHTRATSVEVAIGPREQGSAPPSESRGSVLVHIRDNGGGLKPGHRSGLGLTGMRERLAALGGTLAVSSSEIGVTVEAIVPTGPSLPAHIPSE
jgi:two-component system, NarL family, sensor histidine kinase UhpB